MKLADLRKLSIRQNLKIRFQLPNGMECVITEHGIAEIPALGRAPGFNLEQELALIGEFFLEPAAAPAAGLTPGKGGDKKHPAVPRRLGREELASLATAATSAAGVAQEED
jgi:hypothetical protein